jgi:undecaprenyl-diphosphatase
MNIWHAIVLAIIEGITEFLPISSTGHMILTSALLGIEESPFVKLFEIFIQFGAILSVVVLYFKRFLKQNLDFYIKLLIAFIPTAILGKLLDDYIDQFMGLPIIVGITLFLGGIILLMVDKWFINNTRSYEGLAYLECVMIGIFQSIAMIPGVSRSAATIIGAQSRGLTRKSAAEFSFFLAIPTMAAASLYKLLKHKDIITTDSLGILAIGSLVAFIVALIAIKFFIEVLTRYGFKAFGYYRILIGGIIIACYFANIKLNII